MIEVDSKADIVQRLETDCLDYLIEIDLSMDKILEEETLEEETSEGEGISENKETP